MAADLQHRISFRESRTEKVARVRMHGWYKLFGRACVATGTHGLIGNGMDTIVAMTARFVLDPS